MASSLARLSTNDSSLVDIMTLLSVYNIEDVKWQASLPKNTPQSEAGVGTTIEDHRKFTSGTSQYFLSLLPPEKQNNGTNENWKVWFICRYTYVQSVV